MGEVAPRSSGACACNLPHKTYPGHERQVPHSGDNSREVAFMKRLLARIWGGGLKTALIAGLVAVLVSATTVVAASDFLKKEKYREKEGIFATFKKDAIIPTSSLSRIASLPLDTGKYAIQAKLFATNQQTGREVVRCQLAA